MYPVIYALPVLLALPPPLLPPPARQGILRGGGASMAGGNGGGKLHHGSGGSGRSGGSGGSALSGGTTDETAAAAPWAATGSGDGSGTVGGNGDGSAGVLNQPAQQRQIWHRVHGQLRRVCSWERLAFVAAAAAVFLALGGLFWRLYGWRFVEVGTPDPWRCLALFEI